ncbi:alpha/beta fold hydrolase [Puia dinghuensis]|uniref:Alpha/beta hydrolase n=1 Tax=Puia dinghuensis TaxID=1792502 RepID=A0A8J2UE83_9BACT|nr:alpha/beta fold hydrolase [Puia dinghuensis]GGB05684.1 alpha/beta hydrolase [Puia dinghuensis]
MNKKKLFRWVKVAILVYCTIGIALYYSQEWLLFHPKPMERKAAYTLAQPFTELNLNYDKETNLNVVEFKATDRPQDSLAKGVVLYFHDNTGNIATHASRATDFTSKGYEVWMLDYPGFGKSTGSHQEKDLYIYALVFYKLAHSRWKPAEIILQGTGMGAAIAAQLASVRDCQRLIMEEPAYSLTAAWRKYLFLYPLGTLLHYHFPIYQYLPAVTAPVTMLHGDSRLRSLLKPGDEFIP